MYISKLGTDCYNYLLDRMSNYIIRMYPYDVSKSKEDINLIVKDLTFIEIFIIWIILFIINLCKRKDNKFDRIK